MYDLFSSYLPHGDSGKTRIDMLDFVTDNKACYLMDCHTVLKMHELNLDSWAQRVVCFDNGADELAIYALSDLVQVHTTILTQTKPWTTLHPDLPLQDTFQMLEICDIKLVYLGKDQYGILRKRPSSCVNPILVHAPVFPSPSPLPALEAPSQRDLETADILLHMKNQQEPTSSDIPLQEPTMSVPNYEDITPENHGLKYCDAMEHVLNEVLFPSTWKRLKVQDAMDCICEDVVLTDAMEHVVGYCLPKNVWGCSDGLKIDAMRVLVETPAMSVYVNPSIERHLKSCSIQLSKIDNLLSFLPRKDYCKILTNTNGYHTRSRCKPKPKPVMRHPRAAQICDSYIESDLNSDDEPKKKKPKAIPTSDGPSVERIEAQNRQFEAPKQRVLPSTSFNSVPSSSSSSDTPITEPDPESDDTEVYEPSDNEDVPKGKFKISTRTLKRGKNCKCKYCDFVCSTANELSDHHTQKHRILYCNVCNKAFNNATSYSRHLKSHTERGHQCGICKKAFAYASQLTTHQSVHSTEKHKCTVGTCTKSFKNVGDLTRHVKQHTATKNQCPDCNYSNADLRNFESHRLRHSQIINYTCTLCNKEFVYNTQYQRHIKACGIKGSGSPEY